MSESAPANTSDEAKKRVAETFDRAAPVYGTMGPFDFYGAKLVELAGVKPGMRVLDVAAGKGASARPARDLGADVTAVDLAPAMVEHLHSCGLDARLMDAEQLHFPDRSFDAVLCGFGLFFLPDPEQGARELRRVVRPGGPVAISMPLVFFPAHVYELRREFGARAHGPAIPEPAQGFDGAVTLSAAGFEHVETLDVSYDESFESGEHLWEYCVSTGARHLIERLTPEDAEELRQRTVAGAGQGPVRFTTSARFWLTNG